VANNGSDAAPDPRAPSPPTPRAVVARHAVALHSGAVRRLAASPMHFLALVDQYVAILGCKRKQLLEQRAFLQVSVCACVDCGWSVGDRELSIRWSSGRVEGVGKESAGICAHIQDRTSSTRTHHCTKHQSQHTEPQGGLSKLSGAAAEVDQLGREAEGQRAALTTKQRQADAALAHIQVGSGVFA